MVSVQRTSSDDAIHPDRYNYRVEKNAAYPYLLARVSQRVSNLGLGTLEVAQLTTSMVTVLREGPVRGGVALSGCVAAAAAARSIQPRYSFSIRHKKARDIGCTARDVARKYQ